MPWLSALSIVGVAYSYKSKEPLREAMRINLFLVVAISVLIGCAQTYAAQEIKKDSSRPLLPKVSPELWKRTQEKGTVRVIVDLNVPGWTSKPPSQEAELAQRQMIADTQEKVIAELMGTRYKITHRFYTVGGMGLEIGPDALAVLERSDHVIRVYEDAGISPSPQSIKIEKDPESSK
jgi:hypothetical protein